jgi:phosphate transport system protein
MRMSKEKFHHELDALGEDMVTYGEHALSMLTMGLQAFVEQDEELAEQVYNMKGQLDRWDREVEERALRLLTLHQPMAKDLRSLACILKMDTYLYRIGRYGKDIAKDAIEMGGRPHVAKLVNIPHQHEIVVGMIRDAMRAFREDDIGPIADISERDDQVDAIWESVFRECVTYMIEDAKNIAPCTHYIMVSRHLERCGDHACKIAEKVHYKVTGEHIEIK